MCHNWEKIGGHCFLIQELERSENGAVKNMYY